MKKPIRRHELTPEERREAERLRAAWDAFKAENEGVSQEWLGRQTKIGGQSAVGQYLRGALALNFATLMKFCTTLKVPPHAISPRLVQEHMGDPVLEDHLFERATRAGDRVEKVHVNTPNKERKSPLSSEASDLILCVSRLDSDAPRMRAAFSLVTGLLLLASRAGEFQDTRTAQELIAEAQRSATGILAGMQEEGLDERDRKSH